MKKKYLLLALAPALGYLVAFCLSSFGESSQTPSPRETTEDFLRPVEAVAALGQLSPLGEVRRLAAPISGFGGTPRVARLLIEEGDSVKKGQILAVFDNRIQILSDVKIFESRIKTLEIKIQMQERQVLRYKKAASQGAASLVLLDQEQDELVKLQGELQEAFAELTGLKADLSNSELKAPIDGVILRINARVGERPGEEGVLEVGANQFMEALIEVYESDINRVKVGQSVLLTSENGGFVGTLAGHVKTISPQVRQRRVLSTDPTGDADARVIEVRVTLDSNSAEIVKELTGMKVIARFQK